MKPADRKVELTDGFLRTVKVPKRCDISDTKLEGFQVRVSPKGSKTFAVRARAPSRDSQRVTLGEYPTMRLAEARDLARETIVKIRQGVDVAAEKRAARAQQVATPTLEKIVAEYKAVASAKGVGIWTSNNPTSLPDAERRIRRVFGKLLDRELSNLTEADLEHAMSKYCRTGRTGEGDTANGQVARARSYLISALDWASGRGRFDQLGSHRSPKILAPDARLVRDPSRDDPTITGLRERVLDERELKRILPLLIYPAPVLPDLKLKPDQDFRSIALRFVLLTLARIANVECALWEDIDFERGLWNKPSIKNSKGRQHIRSQTIHLPDAAITLLRSLPGSNMSNPKAHVFPNENGGKLGNWTRFQKALYKATGTNGWHRHDLRRTSSTILGQLSVDVGVVSRLLGHGASRQESASAVALRHYIMQKNIVSTIEAPGKIALDRLADVYAMLEAEGMIEAMERAA